MATGLVRSCIIAPDALKRLDLPGHASNCLGTSRDRPQSSSSVNLRGEADAKETNVQVGACVMINYHGRSTAPMRPSTGGVPRWPARGRKNCVQPRPLGTSLDPRSQGPSRLARRNGCCDFLEPPCENPERDASGCAPVEFAHHRSTLR